MSRPSSFGINQGYLYGEILDGVAHKGIDFSNTLDSPVYSSYAGTVYSIGWSDLEGWYVYVDHGGNVYTYYCHLNSDPRSRPGITVSQSVSAGTLIGYAGHTGSTAKGDHLHFSVRQGNYALSYVRNPEKWLNYLSGTGKIIGNSWYNGSDPTYSSPQIRVGDIPKPSGTYGAYSYGRYIFGFGDAEDWVASDVLTGNRVMSTSGQGNSKTLYVEVSNYGSTKVDYDIGNTINDVNEFNESFATATTIAIGSNIGAYIFNSRDDDYYKLTPSVSGTITVDLTSLPKDYDLAVYNSSYSVITSSMNGGTSNEQVSWYATAGQTYYLLVYGYSGAYEINDGYLLSVH